MMKRLSLAASAVASFALTAHADVKPLDSEDFAKYPAVSSVSMSLEGDMLVGVVADPTRDGEQTAAAYWDLSGDIDVSKPLVPSNITPTSGRSLFFAANALKQKQSLWFTVQPYTGALEGCGEGKTTGATKKYLQKVYMGNERIKKIDDLPNGRAEVGASKMMLRCFELVGETAIASLLPLDPSKVVISRQTTKNGTSYFEHDLATGREKFMFKASDVEGYGLSNRDGSIRSATKLVFEDGAYRQYIRLYNPETGELEREAPLTTEIANRYTMAPAALQEGTNKYFVLTDKFDDKVSVYLYDTVANTFSSEPVFAHPEFDISGIITSQREEDFGQVLGFNYDGPVRKTYWLDPEMKSIQDGLDAAFPGKNVVLNDYTNDRNRVLFTVSAGDFPPAYFLLVDKSKVAVIGSERPWIDTDSLGKSEFVYYEARDGLQIPALITMPAGYQEGQKARGAIIHPHGGPWARDFDNFDGSGWTQYFASRGYIVLRPQFRGSTGWGRKLWTAGDGEWGQKMQDDNDDAAAWLIENGYVDADKVAIHGYSYGGFASIAAVVRPNSPYQCAISGAGVANLARIQNEWGDNRVQRAFQGNTVKGMDPQANTKHANIPILLYHGDYDVRVPIFHSRDFFNAVKKREPQSEFISLKQMGHQGNKWLPEHKNSVLVEMERFLTTTCGM
ncbi:MAG: alpha/beta hydrolase family protein [Henriciella sp.]|jgi:dienelactone hydrolase|mmetsp:Transcript_26915/g.34522  ORF Transcript_26915/g.34522 Transcript_26915/m.34522 type:complete len:675 (-) Transcript_26915:75-2099(-)